MEKLDIKWHYTNKIVNDLLKINRAKEIVDLLEIPISIEEEIKKESIDKRVHYSIKRVKEIYKNSKEEISLVDTLDKREIWVANYIITNETIKAIYC